MVKIFVGNLPRPTTAEEIRALFEKYGEVSECDLIKNYGFVHMDNKDAAKEAIGKLHHYNLHGVPINVEASKSMTKSSTKLHVGKVSSSCTSQELQAKFEEYGPVLECDIIKDYAFVHMERGEDAMDAIKGLDGTEFKGKRMHVELSKSRLRIQPGMGEKNTCFRCGKDGHWSKACPTDRQDLDVGYASDYLDPYAVTPRYGEQPFYDSRYVDYYEKYRAGAYGAVGTPYPDRWGTTYSSAVRERMPKALEAYSQSAISQPPTYYNRDRSPLRRASTATTITDYAAAATEYAAAAAANNYAASSTTDYAAAAASYAQDYASSNYATTTTDYTSDNYTSANYTTAADYANTYGYEYSNTMTNSAAYTSAGTTTETYVEQTQYSAY